MPGGAGKKNYFQKFVVLYWLRILKPLPLPYKWRTENLAFMISYCYNTKDHIATSRKRKHVAKIHFTRFHQVYLPIFVVNSSFSNVIIHLDWAQKIIFSRPVYTPFHCRHWTWRCGGTTKFIFNINMQPFS